MLRNPLSIVTVIALFAFFVLNSKWKARGLAEKCQKCKRVYRPSGIAGSMDDKYCKQCVTTLFKKDGIAPDVQRKKILEINETRQREKLIKILFSVLLPGSRNIYVERGFTGFLILWKWVLLILIVLTGSKYNVHPFRIIDLPFGPIKILAVMLLLQTQITSAVVGLIRTAKGE